jgi:hypothetical protein
VNRQLSGLQPLSIPDHSSIPRPTAHSIVDELEVDLVAWDVKLACTER